jgi:hypothetical protein
VGRYFALFRKWILNNLSLDVITEFTRINQKALFRAFHKFLSKPPVPIPPKGPKAVYLKVDAKYFGTKGSPFSFCVLLYKEGTNLIYWSFARYETFEVYQRDFLILLRWGYTILGVTSDWHGSIVSVVKYLLPDIPHQRCLVHTKRRCKNLLTKSPKTQAGIDILICLKALKLVKTKYEKNIWILWFNRLYDRYENLIKERTYATDPTSKRKWRYTHRNLRFAYRTIKSTLGHLFLYLDYQGLDKDTNGLESEFSHLTEKINFHRGLTRENKISAINWYAFFKSKERLKSI